MKEASESQTVLKYELSFAAELQNKTLWQVIKKEENFLQQRQSFSQTSFFF